MIYEIRTYTLRPGTVAEFEDRFAKRLPTREKHSKLGVIWHTEVGPLNQVVHIWPYEDLEQRMTVRDAMANDAELRQFQGGRDLLVAQESDIMTPAPFMRPLGSQTYGSGNIYEMRVYTHAPGNIPAVFNAWSGAIAEREKLSPLVACGQTEIGGLNKFIHIWVYPNLNERARIRDLSRKDGKWPPQSGVRPIKQENKILVASACSPLQ